MFKRVVLNSLDDYFDDYTLRSGKGVYFCRLTKYNKSVEEFLCRYFDEARKTGVYINGKIPNPDEGQLNFYDEIMGIEFKMDVNFFDIKLKKWLPRLNYVQRNSIAEAMYDVLYEMSKEGKTENMLKNAYIKFMCWYYYKFERILNQLGSNKLPKILYKGSITKYELKVLSIFAKAGCDILLLQDKGDKEYLKVDTKLEETDLIPITGTEFPAEFSLESLQRKRNEKQFTPNVVLKEPEIDIRPNTWIFGDVFQDSLKSLENRGNDSRFIDTVFARVLGVEDKANYFNVLFRWKKKIESDGRKVFVIEGKIPVPDTMEIQKISRKNYKDFNGMILDMVQNITLPKNKELEKYVKSAFLKVMEEDKENTLQRLINRAVILICWINRYLPKIFITWDIKSMPVFVFYSVCKSQNEAYFMKILSKIPMDLLIICPDKEQKCKLQDKFLFEKNYEYSMAVGKFPTQIDNVTFGTVAYHAEQDLNTMLYQDTGMYRNRQFKKAEPVSLKTTFEEIEILWSQEAKYRPNFEVFDNHVLLPVIFSKISGVAESKEVYWNQIGSMMNEDTFLISELPYMKEIDLSFSKSKVVSFISNGKLQVQKIKKHPSYPFAFIREDMQDYMMDKLQQLIDKKIIQGTLTNGVEYTILSTVLNMDKKLLRMIQKFDFTKNIPKLIVIHTDETVCNIEDSILIAYLNLIGFDIAIFVPTGYQSIERFFEKPLFVEHQIGEYMYDLKVPDFQSTKDHIGNIASRLFRRGR